MIGPEHETARPPAGDGFGDSVTFSFADREADLYGLARFGLAPQARQASALAVLFSGTEPVSEQVLGGMPASTADWADFQVRRVRARIYEPLRAWRVELAEGFVADFEALSDPIEVSDTPAAQAAGFEGYEQLCRVEGQATVGGRRRPLACMGQRGHSWGPAPWDHIELARNVSAWLDDGSAIAVAAVRPRSAQAHDEEKVTAFLLDAEGVSAVEVAEPRLSTTYDAEGHQIRAGLELWLGEDDEMPRRAAGEVACGTSFELGRLRLECAFFHWRMEGRAGAGRYDVLRRA